jgi:hypothetical protein
MQVMIRCNLRPVSGRHAGPTHADGQVPQPESRLPATFRQVRLSMPAAISGGYRFKQPPSARPSSVTRTYERGRR